MALFVSTTATLLSSLVGLPLGAFLAMKSFRGRWLMKTGIYTLFALPSVVAGLIVYTLLSRNGPFGILGWLFTPMGMIVAESLLVFPLITGLTISAVSDVDENVRLTIKTLGANDLQMTLGILREARFGIFGAVMVCFGRAVSEVGAVWIVGGNIKGQTQVITTAIVQQVQMGNLDTAFELAAVLLIIAFVIFFVIRKVQERI